MVVLPVRLRLEVKMLEGFVPFPKEFIDRYRKDGYWEDRPLREEYAVQFKKFSDSIALVDGDI